jgi:hypothetical protein
MPAIDQFTLTAIPLELYFHDTPLGHATGFLWQIQNEYYLVTNWHVLSAKDFFTLQNLRPDAGRPNVLRALFQFPGQFQKQEWRIPVRDKDDVPLWLVHPGSRVDIAVLPFPVGPDAIVGLYPLNVLADEPLVIGIGMEVFILGFPFKITPPAFPIWKRGSIASEPELARMSGGYMHVDTASRPGMSGAPVIRRSVGTHFLTDGSSTITDYKYKTKFLGVYSGRIPTDHPYEAQIGLVWHASYINEIIAGNMRDA